jgi:hypothetical protein
LVIIVTIYAFRVVQLALSNLPLKPLAFIAPRGLITILLFLSIAPENRIGLIGSAIIIKIIIISALIMMFGMMIHNKKEAVVAEINTLKPDDVPAKQS